jgi:exodeoxyribonuclease V alpha subunit
MMEAQNLFMHSLSPSARLFGAEIQAAQTDGDSRAGLLAALCFQAAGLGHSCLQLNRIKDVFPEFPVAGTAGELAQIYGGNALACVMVSAQQPVADSLLLVFGDRLYLKKFWRMETELLALLQARLDTRTLPGCGDSARDLALLCQHKRLVLLTGGPGTGKTTAMSAAVALWLHAFEIEHKRPARVVLCAPTGKAAARISAAWQQHMPALGADLSAAQRQALPTQANTLHRVLGFAGTKQNETRLELDLLVVDEASMIDLPMMRRLLRALPETAHLLLIGDPQQLPSIEIGNVLGALLAADPCSGFGLALKTAHLQLRINHRQVASPGLAALAEAVQLQAPESLLERLDQAAFQGVTFQSDPTLALPSMLEAHADFHRQLGGLSSPELALARLQQRILLTPLRHGPLGCEQLNARIARRAQHLGNRHGQAVLVTENVPALGLSNGDIGVIWNDGQGLNAYFKSSVGLMAVPLWQLPKHEAAYALTVHKAQGSEYEDVDLLLPETPHSMVSKALLYTAITRAKRTLCITGHATALVAGLKHDVRRMNGLLSMAEFSETGNTAGCSGNKD